MLNRIDSKNFEAVSAGTSRGRLHPLTVEVMKEVGVELSQKARKHVVDFRDEKFDFVIALDESSAGASQNTEHTQAIHWRIDKPASIDPDEPEKQLRVFRMVRDQIAQRLRLFVIVHVRSQTSSQLATLSMTTVAR